MEKVKLGIVGFTDKGDWVSGYNYTKASTGETVTGYNVNDLVHTAKGIYCSKKAGNTSNPDDDSVNWKAWIDLKQNVTAQANETARQNAEAARVKAEEIRKAAESNRADAETKRTQSETDRSNHETQREEAETQRKANETARQNAEAARVKAEEIRKAAESNRADAETKRTQSETDRSNHETQREEAETQRKANDTQRTADYQAIYDGLQAKSAEIDRLLVSLQQQGSVAPMASIPARIATIEEVTVLAGATINVAPTDVQPSTANRSMIYQIYSGDALVDAEGNVKTSTAGDIIVKVIPTLASGAARIVTIHAKEAEALTDESGNAITDENETEITC